MERVAQVTQRLVIALGGNALDVDTARVVCVQLAELVERGLEIVITHGNGPQVGRLLLDQEGRGHLGPPPDGLATLVAMTQGQLGAPLQRMLAEALQARGLPGLVAAVPTHVLVAPDDPAFGAPTKPVGPHVDAPSHDGASWARTVRGTWRRVVASPLPISLVERATIRAMLDAGIVPICAGGGGVPVVRNGSVLETRDAVIDKDLASALVVDDLGADGLLLLTDVTEVFTGFGTDRARALRELNVGEAVRLLAAGEFPAGSMGPKVAAAVSVAASGRFAAIGSIRLAAATLAGERGTRVLL